MLRQRIPHLLMPERGVIPSPREEYGLEAVSPRDEDNRDSPSAEPLERRPAKVAFGIGNEEGVVFELGRCGAGWPHHGSLALSRCSGSLLDRWVTLWARASGAASPAESGRGKFDELELDELPQKVRRLGLDVALFEGDVPYLVEVRGEVDAVFS